MDNLTCEELMKIIVELNTSYKEELVNKRLEMRCLQDLLYKNNVNNDRIEMIAHTRCQICDKRIADYEYYDYGSDSDSEDSDDHTMTRYKHRDENIFVCVVCNKKTCSECNWAECCKSCVQVRTKAIECREILKKIEKNN